jgi:hypothetical protein
MSSQRVSMRLIRVIWIFLLVQAAGCAHKYAVPPPASGAVIPRNSQVLVVASEDGRDERNAIYKGSGRSTAIALVAALRARQVQAEVQLEPLELGPALEAGRSARADFLVLPVIRSWSDRLTEWSGIPDRITIRIRMVEVASGQVRDDRDVRASSRWATLGGDHPQDLLPTLSEQWAAGVVP